MANFTVKVCYPNWLKTASLVPPGFIFQQDRAPAHTAKLAQNWIATNCSDFVGKDEWPPNSTDFKPLDYHV